MTSKQHKKEMLDYLASKLEGSGEKIEPVHKEIVKGITTSYIRVGDNSLILLLDQVYPGRKFEIAHLVAKQSKDRVAVVILKDGKTFFRNAAEDNAFKRKYELSLKKYSSEEMHRMITFRPEEIYLREKYCSLQYYQPKPVSDRSPLAESLLTFKFKSVFFDYSHLPEFEIDRLVEHGRVLSKEEPVARAHGLYIWTDKEETYIENLVLYGNKLVGISDNELAELKLH